MKKITSLLLAVLLLLSAMMFTSCEHAEAYMAFTDAMKKTDSLDSYECNIKIDQQISAQGLYSSISAAAGYTSEYNIKASGLNSDTPAYCGTMRVGFGSQKLDVSVYNKDGYAYYVIGQKKIKSDIKSAVSIDYNLSDMIDRITVELPEDVLKDVELIKNSDGTKTINLALSTEQFIASFKQLSEYVSVTDNTSIDDIRLSIIITADGYISRFTITFKADVQFATYGIPSISTLITAEVEYVNPGTPVEVKLPDDLNDYTESAE